MKHHILDFRELLIEEHSKHQVLKIVNNVGDDQARFDKLFAILIADENRIGQRASWAVNYCVQQHPFFLKPYYPSLIKMLENPSHVAIKRNILRMLQFVDIPGKWQGTLYQKCAVFLSSTGESIAVRCFSMQVLYNISVGTSELESELRELLIDAKDLEAPGLRARARNLLRRLNKSSSPD